MATQIMRQTRRSNWSKTGVNKRKYTINRLTYKELKYAYISYFYSNGDIIDTSNLTLNESRKKEFENYFDYELIKSENINLNTFLIQYLKSILYNRDNIKHSFFENKYFEFHKRAIENHEIIYKQFPDLDKNYLSELIKRNENKLITDLMYKIYTYKDFVILLIDNFDFDICLKYEITNLYYDKSDFIFVPTDYRKGYLHYLLDFLNINPKEYKNYIKKTFNITFPLKGFTNFDREEIIPINKLADYILKYHNKPMELFGIINFGKLARMIILSNKLTITFPIGSKFVFIDNIDEKIGISISSKQDVTVKIKQMELLEINNELSYYKIFNNFNDKLLYV
jgi:hypothetical protein